MPYDERTVTKLAFAILSYAALASCGPHKPGKPDGGGGGDDAAHVLSAIEVTPTNAIVELDLNMPGSQAFAAIGHYADGVDEDLTSQVTWSVSNPAAGSLTGSTLSIPAFAAVAVEFARITASLGGLEGQAQITLVAYRRTGPAQDFFFVLPYEDPAGPAMKPLDFGTQVPSLDVFFLMDTTGSMFGEITNLKNALTGTIIPGIQAQVPNTQFGAGAYEDFPVLPYGSLAGADCGRGGVSTPDQPLHVFQTITNSVAAVQTGVGKFSTATGPIGCGNDWPEAAIEALYQVATGQGLTGPGPTSVPASTAGVGGVAFRPETMPVVVTITDAMSHAPGETATCLGDSVTYAGSVAAVAHTRQQAKTALGGICARSVGVASIEPSLPVNCTGQADLEDLATATGTRVPPSAWDIGVRPAGCAAGQCCTDINGTGRAPDANGLCPLVFRTDQNGTGLGTHIVTGIRMLTRFATFGVTSERQGPATDVDGTPLPAPHTTADFIKAVIPTGFMLPPPPPNIPAPTFDATNFFNVTPGTRVQFDVRAHNDFVPQTQQPQIFRAVIRVLAGGCTALDQREVLILVPPIPIVIQ